MNYTVWEDLEAVERYATRRYRHWDQRWLNRREQRVVKRLFDRHGLAGDILDVPVGYGRFQRLLSGYGKIAALDFNYYATLYQQQKVGLASLSVNGRAEALPFGDDSYEIIFSLRLLQHVHDEHERIEMLSEFARVSRRWVVVSLYIGSPLHQLWRKISRPLARITILPEEQFRAESQAAGLHLERLVAVLPGLHAHRIALLSV